MNTKLKRYISIAAAFAVFGVHSVPTAFAGGYTKEEVAYITLDSAGREQQTVIVNSFKTNGATSITDYGDYKNIKNLTSTEKPVEKDGAITWNNIDTETFYYQGEKVGGELPWIFTISYTLDGKAVTGEELIGKSGKASITVKADKNPKADTYYTDNYMAQITIVLNGENASDIVCDNAVTATVGNNKQLMLMVLPNRPKTYTITFNANNFEMDGMTIAGIKLSDGLLGNTIDKASDTMAGVTDGIQSLLDGSGRLKNGAQDLESGVALLNTGARSIESSIPILSGGMSDLDNGIWQISSGISTLSSSSGLIRSGIMELDSSSSDISSGISRIEGGLSEMAGYEADIKNGLARLRAKKQMINTLKSSGGTLVDGYAKIKDGAAEIADKKQEIQTGLDTLHSSSTDISAMIAGLNSLGEGVSSISDACDMQMNIIDGLIAEASQDPAKAPMLQQLYTLKYISQSMRSGAGEASGGIAHLTDGASKAQDGLNTLYSAADTFGNAALAMTEGAQTINENLQTLNSGLKEYTDGAANASELYSSAETFGESALKLAQGAGTALSGARTLAEGFNRYAEGVGSLADNYMEFDNGIFDVDRGAQELKAGTDASVSGIDTLCSVVNELCDGIDRLDSSVGALPEGAEQIEDGTRLFYDGLSGVDIAALLTKGSGLEPVSYAAPHIAQTEKVQFLMKTPNLHIDDEKAAESEAPKQSFWQKLVALFKK